LKLVRKSESSSRLADVARVAKECRDRERAVEIEARDRAARDHPSFPVHECRFGDWHFDTAAMECGSDDVVLGLFARHMDPELPRRPIIPAQGLRRPFVGRGSKATALGVAGVPERRFDRGAAQLERRCRQRRR
jgi:hypothetical protein